MKATLDYADNPDKTTGRRYLDDDLYAALSYAENDNKTDRKIYVGGINCSKQNAYAEMIAVQRRFGLRGKIVGYHGIQSFREGEVTPEQAFEIGKATARKMWGDRYQVLVTVHLNTENVHCHFVVNPVSFKDGTKFQNKIGDHKELRRVSDEICREHGLSVLENSSFYGGHKKDYWRHKAGKKTHRDYLREDVEYCLSFATSPREFEGQLYGLGYTLDPVRFSECADKPFSPTVRPPRLGGNTRMGVFATRSPFRPNSIGLSCVRLEAIDLDAPQAPVLHVAGADLMDGTPILDIKPYLPYADSVPNALGGFALQSKADILQVDFPHELLEKIPEEKRQALLRVLAQDPRPAYQANAERVYGFTFAGFTIKFTVCENVLSVTAVQE